MRRVLLMSVVVFIAACGGGVRSDAKPEAAQRNDIPTDRESALLIETLSKTFGSDAVDSCLAAWQDARGVDADGAGPVSRPGAGFRAFLSQCVGAPVPADMRGDQANAARAESVGSMRIQWARDTRSQPAGELRRESAGDLRGTFDQ